MYLVLVGDGPAKGDLLRQVGSLGLQRRVIFAGEQSGIDLVAHYSAANVFIITSAYESFSFVVLEAMACELPVIATAVGRLPKSVEHGRTGLLSQPETLKS